jgi:hypothetical protein
MSINLSDICKIGIVVECESNQVSGLIKSKSDIKGHGLRYRVRIAGVHDEQIPIKDLPFAYPILPVTAGTGHGGASQSCNLKVGSRVYLVFQKEDDTNPLILGSVPNDITTQITAKDPWNYTSGYSTFARVPVYNVPVNANFGNSNGTLCQATYSTVFNESDYQQGKDVVSTFYLPKPSSCEESIPLGKIQLELKSAIQGVQSLRKNTKSWTINTNLDVGKFLRKHATRLTDLISGFFKDIEKKITDKIQKGSEELYYLLFPSERQKAKQSIETALDLIGCLFKKIGKRLFGLMLSLLQNIVNKVVNVPNCFVENFGTSVLSKLIGLLSNSLDSILSPLKSIITGIGSIIDNILEIVENILTFISCEEKQYCPEISNWSLWNGSSLDNTINLDFSKVSQKIQGTIDSVGDLTIDDLAGNLNLDFSDIFSNSCNIGPLLCGPPSLNVFGGGGSGTQGNVIVSSAGQILGVDITYPGSGYTSTPKIQFNDACAIGGGAVGTAVLGPIPILPPEIRFVATQIDNNKYNLSWTTTNAVNVDTNFGSTSINGNIILTPNQQTTYTITAYNKNNTSTTKSVLINPLLNQTTTSPELLLSSNFVRDNIYRVSWTTENAIRVVSNFNVQENILNGNKEVSPTVVTSYTMTAYDSNGVSTTKTLSLYPRIISPSTPIIPEDNNQDVCSSEIILNNLRILEEYPPDEIGVIKIIINQPGSNYLPSSDGRLGGDGRVWAEANQTYVIRANGDYDDPYSPGSVIELNRCDTVVPPCEPKFIVQEKSTYIAPDCSRSSIGSSLTVNSTYPILQNGKYPVILYLCDVIIDDPGLNYSQGDEVIIEPSNGASARAEFNEFGRITKIKILSSGEGFTTRPIITIKSSTGFNASIIPVLCIDRVGTNNELNIPYDSTKVLHVVDCPGNIYV